MLMLMLMLMLTGLALASLSVLSALCSLLSALCAPCAVRRVHCGATRTYTRARSGAVAQPYHQGRHLVPSLPSPHLTPSLTPPTAPLPSPPTAPLPMRRYQGESNMGRAAAYTCQIQALMRTWRTLWHAGSGGQTSATFPLGVVQLAGCTSAPGDATFGFTALRWAQTAQLGSLPNSKMPNTFLATAYDLGDSGSPFGSVHIRWKQDVAKRLALSARRHRPPLTHPPPSPHVDTAPHSPTPHPLRT
jgi:hypothetical protein